MIIVRRIKLIPRISPIIQLAPATLRTVARSPPQIAAAVEPIVQRPSSAAPLSSDHEIDWNREMEVIRASESRSVIAPVDDTDDAASTAYPLTRPSHNLAAYVKRSPTLRQFIDLGVDLHQIERRNGLAKFVANLDFDVHVQPHLRFLADIGLPVDALGKFLTKNPLIFKEDLDDLTTRVNYLESKLFKGSEIARIVEKNPFWLMFSTQRIDGRLGFFQKSFELSGAQIRQLVLRQPKLITYSLDSVRKNSFVIREELGFEKAETKALLLAAPKLWMMNADNLTSRFEYIHKRMGIAHDRLVLAPDILYCREHRLRQRHKYLQTLGKAQYDPTRDLFVSFKQLAEGSDSEFALNVARTSYADFETFLRTM